MVLAETVQTEGVVELNATTRPDDADADIVKGAVPIVLPAIAANVIVCAVNAADDTANDCVTCVATL